MGGLFKPKAPKQEAPPPPPPVVEMPDPESPEKKLSAQKNMARRVLGSGRQSTFVTQNRKDKLGG